MKYILINLLFSEINLILNLKFQVINLNIFIIITIKFSNNTDKKTFILLNGIIPKES